MIFMFDKCFSLKKLNIKNFYINDECNVSCMFCTCKSLKELDISNSNNDILHNMFLGCTEK